MSWYDVFNPVNDVQWLTGTGDYDPTKATRANLDTQGQNASGFANQAQQNYNASTGQLGQSTNYLRDLMMGRNSVSQMQLEQAARANQSQQMSMAAGASPNNAAMAARQAAMNAGRIGYGLAGQQAVAGLQERNQAANQLGQILLQQRGQDVNATLGGQQNANSAYSSQLQNPEKTTGQQVLNAGVGIASALATKSDRRAKEDIRDADGDASKTMKGLRAFTYNYKDTKDGKGRQFGIMAQDLEKAGLKHAVIDTPSGKYVDGGKAATAGLALIGALGRRLEKLEGKRKK